MTVGSVRSGLLVIEYVGFNVFSVVSFALEMVAMAPWLV